MTKMRVHELAKELGIENKELDPHTLTLTSDTKIVQDFKGNYLLLFANEWNIDWAYQHNEGLVLSEFNR